MIRKTVLAAALFATLSGPAHARPIGNEIRHDGEVATAMDFLASLGRLDLDAVDAALADEVVLELPFAGEGLTVTGRDAVMAFFRKTMAGSVGHVAYRLERAYPSPEAGALILEVSTQAQTAAGRAYTNRLVVIVEFRGGRIALFREYFNPAPLKPAS